MRNMASLASRFERSKPAQHRCARGFGQQDVDAPSILRIGHLGDQTTLVEDTDPTQRRGRRNTRRDAGRSDADILAFLARNEQVEQQIPCRLTEQIDRQEPRPRAACLQMLACADDRFVARYLRQLRKLGGNGLKLRDQGA